jgi:hypothetical protein
MKITEINWEQGAKYKVTFPSQMVTTCNVTVDGGELIIAGTRRTMSNTVQLENIMTAEFEELAKHVSLINACADLKERKAGSYVDGYHRLIYVDREGGDIEIKNIDNGCFNESEFGIIMGDDWVKES